MTHLSAICALCDAAVNGLDVWAHYSEHHPERATGDWALKQWPDGTAALIDLPDIVEWTT